LFVSQIKVSWKGASERVIILFVVWQYGINVSCAQRVGLFGMQPKVGGILHLKLNTGKKPIAYKYREGKMKSTLKRESNST